jgi:hypothetical protein
MKFAPRGLAAAALPLLMAAGCAGPSREVAIGQPDKGPWNLPGKPPHLVAHYKAWFRVPASTPGASSAWAHWKRDGGDPAHDPERRGPDGLRDLASGAYPLIGPYDSGSREVMRYHLRTAKAAGIQAFLMGWRGPGSEEDRLVRPLLDLAGELGMRVALGYEEKANFPPCRNPATREEAVAGAANDLAHLLREYGVHPAYLKRNGAPFVFQSNGEGAGALGPNAFTPAEIRAVLARLPSPVACGRQGADEAYHPPVPCAWVGWTPDAAVLDRFVRRANDLRREGRLQFTMSAVCPGPERRGLSVFRDTFDRAFNGSPELVQVLSWNDFEEGTAVEPTRADGFWFLDALEVWWGELTGSRVDLADNRAPFEEFAGACSSAERAELPPRPWKALLAPRPLGVERGGSPGSAAPKGAPAP